MKTISKNSNGADFIRDINDNFAECVAGGDGTVAVKVPLQGGDLKSTDGRVDGRWCAEPTVNVGDTIPSQFTYTDDDFTKYLHTPCYLSLNGNSIKEVTEPTGCTLSIFCYDGSLSLINGGVVNDEDSIPDGTVYVKLQIYNTNGFQRAIALDMTLAAQPQWVKNVDTALVPRFFNYECKPKKLWDTIGTTLHSSPTGDTADVDAERYHDNGFILLPPTYSPTGKPTKFVIFLQGDGAQFFIMHNPYVTTKSGKGASTIYETNWKYLCNNGYAVVSLGGYTSMWKNEEGATSPSKWSPKWTDSYRASLMGLYEYLMANYNLEPEAYLAAKSAGGSALVYLASNELFPVRAAAGISIAISLVGSVTRILQQAQKSLHKRLGASNWNSFTLNQSIGGSGNNIDAVRACTDGNTSQRADAALILADKELYLDLDPFTKGSSINFDDYVDGCLKSDFFAEEIDSKLNDAISSADRKLSAPTKLWCSTADPAVPYYWHRVLADWIQRGGGVCELRSYTGDVVSGGSQHHVFCGGVANGGKVANNLPTPYGATMNGVNIGIVEAVEWFKRW